MNDLEAMKYLEKNITFNANEQTFATVQYFFNEFNSLFGFENFEVVQIINREPIILSMDRFSIIAHFNEFGKVYNIKSSEFKNLIMKCPIVLTLMADELSRKIELIKTVFGCDFLSAVKTIYSYPKLLSISKEFVGVQICMLSKELDLYGLEIRKLFSLEHRLLFVSKKQISEFKRYFMHFFGLNEVEIVNVIKAVPEILFVAFVELEKKFKVYYPNLFIKRDIKEILINCPEFIKLKPEVVCDKISQIETIFEVEKKKACEFVRRFPDVLFYENFEPVVNNVINLGIDKKYLYVYPNCLRVMSITLPVKFMFARILNLEQEFNRLIEIPLNVLVSRFVFMQQKKIFEHKNLILSKQEFQEYYARFGYKESEFDMFEKNTLYNICEFYKGLEGKLSSWKNIPFPALDEIFTFVKSEIQDDIIFKIPDRKIDFQTYQEVMKFTDDEIKFLANKNSQVFKSRDFFKLVLELIKVGYSLEEVALLLLKKPSMFLYSYYDFVMLVDEITKDKSISVKTVIENIL